MKKMFFALSVVALLATSCKKDDAEKSSNVTATKENLTGSYMLSKVAAQVGSYPESDVTNVYLEQCDRDDIYKLNADDTYQVVDAGEQCDNDYQGDWSLTNATTIVIDGDTYTIRKFDGKSLELVLDSGNGKLISYYTKQ